MRAKQRKGDRNMGDKYFKARVVHRTCQLIGRQMKEAWTSVKTTSLSSLLPVFLPRPRELESDGRKREKISSILVILNLIRGSN